VLRRVSAGGGEAVALHQDIGKFNHEFAHAADGEIITAVITSAPPNWGGSQPDRLRSLAKNSECRVNTESTPTTSMTFPPWRSSSCSGRASSGLRLSPSDLERPMRSARILPPLEDLPPAPPPGQEFRIGNDPVLDLLLNRAGRAALKGIAAVRVRRLMAETGLGSCPELVTAVGKR